MRPEPLTTFEIAKHCHVTHRTVQQWIASGKLKAYKTPGNHNRVLGEDFYDFLNTHKMPIPKQFNNISNSHKKVLIVDDDPTMVLTIQELLKQIDNQLEIQEAYDGFSAGKKFAEFLPDLITLDIKMPYIDGFEVLRSIRKDPINKNVKVLVISSVNEKAEIRNILNHGADEFIVKPFDAILFKNTVNKLLEAEYVSPKSR